MFLTTTAPNRHPYDHFSLLGLPFGISNRSGHENETLECSSTTGVQLEIPQRFARQNAFKRKDIFFKDELENICQQSNFIGKGSFSVVYKGEIDGEKVAVKKLNSDDETALHRFKKEAEMLSSLMHKNVVKFVGHYESPNFHCLITEYVRRETLYHHLAEGESLHWSRRFTIIADIFEGLHYLHTREPAIVHCDLKPQNIFIAEDFTAKIGDIGLAKSIALNENSYESQTGIRGTFTYMDPSFVNTLQLGTFFDIYSFGRVLLDILFGMKGEGRMKRSANFYVCVNEAKKSEKLETVIGLLDPTAGRWPEAETLITLDLMLGCMDLYREKRPKTEKILSYCSILREKAEKYQKQTEKEEMQRIDEERRRNYFCPISHDLIRVPVVAADGFCYEKSAIEEWFREHDTSPMTNLKVDHKILNPSYHIQKEIRDILEKERGG